MIGDHIKVSLPGETPWAIVVAELDDGRVVARLDNNPVSHLHGYKLGDLVTFEPKTVDGFTFMALADLSRQVPAGPRG